MEKQNLEYLEGNLKYMGFPEKLNAELENNIALQIPQFVLHTQTEFNKEKLEATLHFRRGENGEHYFFNKYEAVLKNDLLPEKGVRQTFYVTKGHGVTFKEAYNLLEGRSVYKELTNGEGQKYKAWLQLDFKQRLENGNYKMNQYHENYGYDLEKQLEKYAIKEMTTADSREKLLKSLEKGNLHTVSFLKDGKEEKLSVEASPQFKTIRVYDKDMKPVRTQSLEQQNQKENGQEQKKEEKQDLKKEEEPEKKQDLSRKKEKEPREEKKTRKRSKSNELSR